MSNSESLMKRRELPTWCQNQSAGTILE